MGLLYRWLFVLEHALRLTLVVRLANFFLWVRAGNQRAQIILTLVVDTKPPLATSSVAAGSRVALPKQADLLFLALYVFATARTTAPAVTSLSRGTRCFATRFHTSTLHTELTRSALYLATRVPNTVVFEADLTIGAAVTMARIFNALPEQTALAKQTLFGTFILALASNTGLRAVTISSVNTTLPAASILTNMIGPTVDVERTRCHTDLSKTETIRLTFAVLTAGLLNAKTCTT